MEMKIIIEPNLLSKFDILDILQIQVHELSE